jgi:CAAX protease family protein
MSSKTIYTDEPARGWLPWGPLAPFLCIAFAIAGELAGVFALRPLRLEDSMGDPFGVAGLAAFLLVPFTVTGLAVLGWVRFVERRSPASIGLASSDRLKRFSCGLAIGIAMSFALVAAIWVMGGYEAQGFARAFHSPSALAEILLLLLCFGVQSSVEEILFRGWLLSVLTRKFNFTVAVVLTSFVFALLHFDSHQHPLVPTAIVLFSVFTCLWCRNVGHVWSAMGWHAGWNWLLGIGFEVPITGIDVQLPALLVKLSPIGSSVVTGGRQGPEGSWFCSLLFVLASGWIVSRSRRIASRT